MAAGGREARGEAAAGAAVEDGGGFAGRGGDAGEVVAAVYGAATLPESLAVARA